MAQRDRGQRSLLELLAAARGSAPAVECAGGSPEAAEDWATAGSSSPATTPSVACYSRRKRRSSSGFTSGPDVSGGVVLGRNKRVALFPSQSREPASAGANAPLTGAGVTSASAKVGGGGPPSARLATPHKQQQQQQQRHQHQHQHQQLFLDVGQRNFAHTTCPGCGLLYAPGLASDESAHKDFHSRHATGIRFKLLRHETAVPAVRDRQGGAILQLRLDDDSAATAAASPAVRTRKRLADVGNAVERDLGMPPGSVLRGCCQVFLHLSRAGVVIGCAVVERVDSAWRLEPPACEPTAEGDDSKARCLRALPEAEPCVCGVRAVWVRDGQRRCGVGRRLLDAVRARFLDCFLLGERQLAFSQPTEQGRAFAARYTGEAAFLVYQPAVT